MMSPMSPIAPSLTQALAAFDARQDPSLLADALQVAGQAAAALPGWSGPLAHWLALLAALDRHLDATWDPADVPDTAAIPPPAADGSVGFSGIDPAAVTDPAARAAYEAAREALRAKAGHYLVQQQLRRAGDDAMQAVETLLRDRWTESPENRQAFEDALAAVPVDEARKQQLRGLPGRT